MSSNRRKLLEILCVSTKLGLISFGGPVAHLGYFYEEYVKRRKWLDEQSYADLVALSHFLPGPASSQVGIGIGIMRGGLFGGLLSFIGFTLPSTVALIVFASLLEFVDVGQSGWLHGLKLVAVAIVAQAIWGMGQKLAPDRARVTIMVFAAAVALLWPTTISQVIIILLAGCAGLWWFSQQGLSASKAASTDLNATQTLLGGANNEPSKGKVPVDRGTAAIFLMFFVGLFIILPIVREWGATSFLFLCSIAFTELVR